MPPASVAVQESKATGLRPGPAKGRRPLETIYSLFDNLGPALRLQAERQNPELSSSEARGSAWRAAFHLTQEPPNDDKPSPTHDRGHADTQPLTPDAELLRSASFHVRPAFRQIPGGLGARGHP